MSGSLNKATLIGDLGEHREIRSFQNGGRAANLAVTTSESWIEKTTGERKKKTEWHVRGSRRLQAKPTRGGTHFDDLLKLIAAPNQSSHLASRADHHTGQC